MASVVIGIRTASNVADAAARSEARVPRDLWSALVDRGFIHAGFEGALDADPLGPGLATADEVSDPSVWVCASA